MASAPAHTDTALATLPVSEPITFPSTRANDAGKTVVDADCMVSNPDTSHLTPFVQTSDLTAHDSHTTRKVPIHIAPEHLAELRSLSESLRYVRGKSDILQHELKKNYPDAHLTDNELRCRIKRRRTSHAVQVESQASAPILPPRVEPLLPEMGRATSCSSCRKKHMKCGVFLLEVHLFDKESI
ncbi:hypothetical protein PHMEG_00038562 [Phytophthora megakarya]|uniref:Uncharacterized protein n=1 Tax=Phytophthora megakarya TaxID=4795 RepID=A0A225UIN4_9STRA|nr:hypothetical protein PHMEG_00038562 [Phytophthora megakarya]